MEVNSSVNCSPEEVSPVLSDDLNGLATLQSGKLSNVKGDTNSNFLKDYNAAGDTKNSSFEIDFVSKNIEAQVEEVRVGKICSSSSTEKNETSLDVVKKGEEESRSAGIVEYSKNKVESENKAEDVQRIGIVQRIEKETQGTVEKNVDVTKEEGTIMENEIDNRKLTDTSVVEEESRNGWKGVEKNDQTLAEVDGDVVMNLVDENTLGKVDQDNLNVMKVGETKMEDEEENNKLMDISMDGFNLSRPSIVASTPEPSNQTKSYFTPAKTVLKHWNPSLLKRSSLFSGGTKSMRKMDATETLCESRIEEEEEDELVNKGDDEEEEEETFEVSLMKLEKKLEDMENETPFLNKDCSKLFAYHKTVIAEREEDCKKLTEGLAEMTSFIEMELQNLSQSSDKAITKTTTRGQTQVAIKLDPIVESPKVVDKTEDAADDDDADDLILDLDDGDFHFAKEDGDTIVDLTEDSDVDQNERNDTIVVEDSANDGEEMRSVVEKVGNDMKSVGENVGNDVEIVEGDVLSTEQEDVLTLSYSDNLSEGELSRTVSPSSGLVSSEVPSATSELPVAVAEAEVVPFHFDERFVSDDPSENLDNDSPDWELMKRLETDQERYKALRQRWGSLTIPNPNLNYTSRNYMRMRHSRENAAPSTSNNNATQTKKGRENKAKNKHLQQLKQQLHQQQQQALNPRKRKHVFDEMDAPNAKKRKCTLMYSLEIDSLLASLEGKRYKIRMQMQRELTTMAVRQEREMAYCYHRYGNHTALFHLQTMEVERLTLKFRRQLVEAERQTAEYVNMLRRASEEITTFHRFYENLDPENVDSGSLFLTQQQILEIFETDTMIKNYPEIYA